jgi:hypothetical protein
MIHEQVLIGPRRRGGPYRPSPDLPPSCPSCGGTLELSQPDPDRPDLLSGVCPGARCGELVVMTRREGRLVPVERIGRDRPRVRHRPSDS